MRTPIQSDQVSRGGKLERRAVVVASSLAVMLALTGCAQLQGALSDGRYDGELCVATGTQSANCGPAQVWLSNHLVQVRVSDIVYRLFLSDGELDLVLMHGAMQVDAFSAPYTWIRRELQFVDPDKPVHYRIRFGDRAPPPA